MNNYSYYLSLRGENLEKAEAMAKKANEIEPGNSSFEDTYAWVLYKLGKYDEAKVWIEKAVKSNKSNSAVILEHYGDILYKLNMYEDAFKLWEKATNAGEGSEYLKQKIKDKKLYE
jgi:tetratricopeptide (TPR) repeat protein